MASRTKKTAPSSNTETVAEVLESYASRGVFRGFSRGTVRGARSAFKLLWHRDRSFDLTLDESKGTLHIPLVLPEVPAKSSMYREYQEFVESRQGEELPEHRRIDTKKSKLQSGNRGGDVSLTLTVLDGDFEYGARKLVNFVHETYMTFLYDGRYYDYMIEKFDLDPDKM